MKSFFILLILLSCTNAFAENCNKDKSKLIIKALKNPQLMIDDKGKLEKLTGHDYPIGCDLVYMEKQYTLFTDAANYFYILKDVETEKYYEIKK